jgi:hypothetical protein
MGECATGTTKLVVDASVGLQYSTLVIVIAALVGVFTIVAPGALAYHHYRRNVQAIETVTHELNNNE